MANLNRVFLIGNLTRDPEIKYLPSGSAVCTFTLASNRVYKLPNGERKEETCFVRIVVWAKMAENCAEYLKKGSSAFVEGRLTSRSWDGPDGQKRSTMEVTALAVQFLGSPRGGRPASGGEEGGYDHPAPHAAPSREPLEEISLDAPAPDPPSDSDGSQVVPF